MANKTTKYEWAKLFIASLIFVFLVLVHALIRELPTLLFGFPGLILGVDIEKLLGRGK